MTEVTDQPAAWRNMTDVIATWYGAANIERDWERVRRFWAGQGRCMATLTLAEHRPRQDTPDEKRFHLHYRSLREQARRPGPNIPSVFGDYGTISNARYWGGKTVVAEETGNPHIRPAARTVTEALRLTPRPVDDPKMDAARLLRLYGRLRDALGTERLWMRMLDPSGPLNTAAMIFDQAELYMAMTDSPNQVREVLERVTDFVMALWRHQMDGCGGRVCGSIWPYIVLPPEVGVVVTEDLMPLLSPDLYGGLGLPILQRLAEEFGGLAVHCCGRYAHQVEQLRRLGPALRAIEFHHPYTTIEDLEPLADTTVFVPYLAVEKQGRFAGSVEFYRYLLEETPERFRYWFACLEEDEATVQFVRELDAPWVAGQEPG